MGRPQGENHFGKGISGSSYVILGPRALTSSAHTLATQSSTPGVSHFLDCQQGGFHQWKGFFIDGNAVDLAANAGAVY